jgi:hypothetical protein
VPDLGQGDDGLRLVLGRRFSWPHDRALAAARDRSTAGLLCDGYGRG